MEEPADASLGPYAGDQMTPHMGPFVLCTQVEELGLVSAAQLPRDVTEVGRLRWPWQPQGSLTLSCQHQEARELAQKSHHKGRLCDQ